MDLKSAFHQIRISPGDIEKTAFKTKYGHFELLVLRMGLRNSPDTFRALMNSIFRDCIDDFVAVFLDDILIFSNVKEEHLRHLRIVLSSVQENDLYVWKSKYELLTKETEFIGLMIGSTGVKIREERKKLIKKWARPKSISDVQIFPGLAPLFRRSAKDFSRVATPLTNLAHKVGNMNSWTKSILQRSKV